MKLELQSGALRLARGQLLKVVDGAGATVCAREGSLWITEENRVRDVVLEPGGCYRLAGRGAAVIEALGEASFSFS
jgi:hypothetical protein